MALTIVIPHCFHPLGKLTVLKELFGRVSVPQAVHEELSRKGHFPWGASSSRSLAAP